MAAFGLVLLLATAISGWGLYALLSSFANRLAATTAAVVYVLAPYRAIDLYDRFAFAEFLAFVWPPLLVLGLRRVLVENRPRWWIGLALSCAGLILTHLLTALMALVVLAPYVAVLLTKI